MALRALWQRWWQGRRGRRGLRGARRVDAARMGGASVRSDPKRIEDWEARIEAAGIDADWATRLAPRLAESQPALGRGSSSALIRGAALALALQSETQAHVERSLKDVREVERLLGAFTGELAKLDEVLEVLAAYAQRMRPQKPNGSSGRLLH
ncbi:MAG: hypothetical protein R3F35_01410 [Myxococcota bacterium]